MPEFIHLHNHTDYSLLDGACTVGALVQAAVENKMSAVALTDHGVLSGAILFYKKARKAGIKPIVGMEAYVVAKGSRFEKGGGNGKAGGCYHHLILLAKNEQGYRHLIKLSTLGHTEGFYYKPRIDLELLRQYHDGLCALSACSSGVVASQLAEGNYGEAREVARTYKDIFGDDFYLEIQQHGMEKEKRVLEGMPRLSRELGIKLVATNDCHYIKPEHALAHNILLLIPDANINNPVDHLALRYGTDQIYFKSSDEMVKLFKSIEGGLDAIETTLEVADKCNLELDFKTNHMPQFPIPSDANTENLDDYLGTLAKEGLKRRYDTITAELENRLNYELGVIKQMGYSGYFLIVQDFISSAREMGVRVGPGRGSAAGSLVSYALGVTSVDPLKYDLLFERFLNPHRISMPDIDVDFADDKRESVIDYVRKKYGANSVSQIITFGTLSCRAVLKDVGRVLGVPLSTIESITKQIPIAAGKVASLAEAIETVPELNWIKTSDDPKIKELIEYSLVLEGLNRNASTHAAGVVIAPGDISDYVPLYQTPRTEAITQFNMKDLETAGLLKMDFLGLRTLTVVENALKLIKQNYGIALDIDSIPLNDEKTYELFGTGQTVAVFQFESAGMRECLKKLKPTCINDLVAVNALYRPGPMGMIDDFIARKHGRARIEYPHPRLEPILKDTYGICIFQEHVMKIASEIAGFSLAEADLMRRAMGKKDKDLMAKQKKQFVEGAVRKGLSKRVAGDIFDMIAKFASYGFNKSHSLAYSILAYQTAYLKAHYTAEFMAATLSSEIGNTDRIVLLIDDCRKMGIEVLPPDVNESGVHFVVTPKGIRFGLAAIKNVGVNAVEEMIRARTDKGAFKNIYDFCKSVDLRIVNRKTIESLVQAGACDSLEGHRAQLLEVVERAMQYAQGAQSAELRGQASLFEGCSASKNVVAYPPLPDLAPWSESENLSREKVLLGFYVSGHPLTRYEDEVNAFANVRLGEPQNFQSSVTVRACGIISGVRKKTDKRGKTMAFVTLEDFTGKGRCIVFSDAFQKFGRLVEIDAMVMVIGKGETDGDSLTIIINEVYPMAKVREKFAKSITVSFNINEIQETAIVDLRKLMEQHRGNCSLYFSVENGVSSDTMRFYSKRFAVEPSDRLIAELKRMFGARGVQIAG